MIKSVNIFYFLVLLLWGCGQSSKLDPSVKARTTAEAYGDGKHIIRTVVVPLSDQLIESFDSPLAKVHFFAGGFAKMFMELGASMGLGKAQLTLFQPVPEIPQDYIKSLSLKRIFFYIEPTKGNRIRTFWEKYIIGRSDVDFSFLDKLAVKVKSHKVENVKTWSPHFEARSLSNNDYSPLETLFENEEKVTGPIDPNKIEELVVVKYDKEKKLKSMNSEGRGKIFILNAQRPVKVKRFLEENRRFKKLISNIHILLGKKKKYHYKGDPIPGALIIELHSGTENEEKFKNGLSDISKRLDEFGVEIIEGCTELTCMDMKVPDVNLLPLMSRGNAVKIDTFMDARSVPDSFQLKGFIEFEIKIKLGF